MSNAKLLDWDKMRCIACVGETGAGKTLACHAILNNMDKDRKKYIFNHPYPSILDEVKIENLEQLSFDNLIDCAVFIDEPQIYLTTPDDIRNLLRLLSLARQRDISVVFATSDTRWLSKGLEAFIDCWVIKDMDYSSVKQGSKIKHIIRESIYNIMPEAFSLPQDEALVYCRKQIKQPLRVKVAIPPYWNDKFSKPYKYRTLEQSHHLSGYQNAETKI